VDRDSVIEQAGDSDLLQHVEYVWADAVAAGLVPREGRAVEQDHPQSRLRSERPERRGRAGRTSADDRQIPDRPSLLVQEGRIAVTRRGHYPRSMTKSPGGGLVVVGGGPAGLAAATAYREGNGPGPVRLISADTHPPYNRPPLTKDFLQGESGEDELPLQPASFYADQDIELMLMERVEDLRPRLRTVTLASGRAIEYGRCVLATGSEPAVLPVPGGDDSAVVRLRFLHQARSLLKTVESASSAVVVGSGFIGCEAAASLAVRGLTVTMVSAEELPQLSRLGRNAAGQIAGWLREAGVTLIGNADVASIGGGARVTLADGGRHEADLVLTAVGIKPQSQLAVSAGLAVEQDRVVVDEHMRTSSADVFAAGDVAFALNGAVGRHLAVEHWGEAEAMGQAAGDCAAGGSTSWAQAPGFWSEIGEHTLKYSAWGDGYDEARYVDHGQGGFTVWYGTDGVTVGVLTHEADDDYDRGMTMVEQASPLP
jgi:NADPH-dependent 2,4-dienoyl-CoA reductase/sulfur reductase-like enzyme